MILKYILLTSFCVTFANGETSCGQYMRDNLSDGSECIKMAELIGKAKKRQMLEKKGSLASYEASCLAIDETGMNIDYTFNISYTIS